MANRSGKDGLTCLSRRALLGGFLLVPFASACGASASSASARGAARIERIVATSTPSPQPPIAKTIFLDPGHGGIDWGAKAQRPDGTWVAEKTYTLQIAQLTAPLLERLGFRVVLSRTGDAASDRWAVNAPPRDLNRDGTVDGIDDVQARIDAANQAHADLLLSIHLNAHALPNGAVDPSFGGVTTLYDPDRSFAAQNERFAELVQREMLRVMTAALGRPPRDWGAADDTTLPTPFTTSHTSYHHDVELGPSEPGWISASQMPGVISEPLFLTNPDEQAAVLEESVRRQIAAGYQRAVQAYFGVSEPSGG